MTDEIAADLELFGTSEEVDLTTFKPTFTATVFRGYVLIKWDKGPLDAVNIYTRLQGTETWLLLDRDNASPYQDVTPLAVAGKAEVREYLLRGVVKDVEIGVPSDIANVLFGG